MMVHILRMVKRKWLVILVNRMWTNTGWNGRWWSQWDSNRRRRRNMIVIWTWRYGKRRVIIRRER